MWLKISALLFLCLLSTFVYAQDDSKKTDSEEIKIDYYKLFLSETYEKGNGKYNVLYFQSHISSERFIKNISIEFGDFKSRTEYLWPKLKYLEWSEKPMVLELSDVLCNGEDHCISFTMRDIKGSDMFDPANENFKEIMDHFQKKIARSYFRSLVFF